MTVRIVTDSTSDLPAELVQELEITVVPLSIQFGSDSYIDGVDLNADGFYKKLISSPVLPTTSQPTPAAFIKVYEDLSRETDEIVSIHISPKLSGTLNSAVLGHEGISLNSRIEIIDSQMASMGLGLIVIQAARAAKDGASIEEVIEITKEAINKVHFFGMVDTLEYLHKGGRIGKAQALMGSLLNIKPIIGCEDGEVHPLGKARTRKKALVKLFEMVQQHSDITEMTILHSTVPEEAESFTRKACTLCEKENIYQARIGPVIGTYLGPGSVAVGVVVT